MSENIKRITVNGKSYFLDTSLWTVGLLNLLVQANLSGSDEMAERAIAAVAIITLGINQFWSIPVDDYVKVLEAVVVELTHYADAN